MVEPYRCVPVTDNSLLLRLVEAFRTLRQENGALRAKVAEEIAGRKEAVEAMVAEVEAGLADGEGGSREQVRVLEGSGFGEVVGGRDDGGVGCEGRRVGRLASEGGEGGGVSSLFFFFFFFFSFRFSL